MASKDIGRGFGDLNGSLKEWHCPVDKKNYPVGDWQIVFLEINGSNLEGRKCPNCEFKAFQYVETVAMIPPAPVVVPPVVAKPKKARKKKVAP